MATPAYIKGRVKEQLISCVRLNKFNDGFSCAFEFKDKSRKALYPSTKRQALRIWSTQADVLSYVKQKIGWTGPMFDQHLNKIQ